METIPKTARAAVLTVFGAPLEIRTFPIGAPEPGGALVKVEAAGVCGTDVHLWKGQLPIPRPLILGHEAVGVIAALGEGVTSDWRDAPLAVGDRVTWSAGLLCGHCYYCALKRQPTRCVNRKAYGISFGCDAPPHLRGSYAEYVHLLPRTAIFKLGDLPAEPVIGAGCALVTALHGIERAGIGWGDTVVVQGSGPVGLSAVAVARTAGAARVIVIGGPRHRLDLAQAFGADLVIDIDEVKDPAQRVARILRATDGHGADAVIECVGAPVVVAEGFEMCREGGKYLVLGHYADGGPTSLNPHVITRKQLTVYGSWASEPRHMASALDFLARRPDLPFARLAAERFPLEAAFDALQTSARFASAKSVIAP